MTGHQEIFEQIAFVIDMVGITIILWGFLKALSKMIMAEFASLKDGSFIQRVQMVRCELGTYLLVGLEFMIVSDLVHSVVSHTLEDLALLATIVAIRTAIGYFLGKELQEIRQEEREELEAKAL